MVIAVLADEGLKKELLSKPVPSGVELVWADSVRSLSIIDADACMDLLFEFDQERIGRLRQLLPRPVFVNSVVHTIREINQPFTRINAWPTMLQRPLTELAVVERDREAESAKLFETLGWPCQFVPDLPGMVTPRIVATIINEAWYTFGDGTGTREDIDTAMKLGTGYPFGPFEWGQRIGLGRICDLLTALRLTDARYTIAPALIREL